MWAPPEFLAKGRRRIFLREWGFNRNEKQQKTNERKEGEGKEETKKVCS
jgi:hypothetical protein